MVEVNGEVLLRMMHLCIRACSFRCGEEQLAEIATSLWPVVQTGRFLTTERLTLTLALALTLTLTGPVQRISRFEKALKKLPQKADTAASFLMYV